MDTSKVRQTIANISPHLAEIAVVLVETSHPGNIGASARAAKTMGLSKLRLVAPKQFPHKEAIALASGADDLLEQAQVSKSLTEAIADCGVAYACSARQRGIRLPELDPRQFARHALDHAAAGPVAVVFGNERVGLSNDEIERCQFLVRIPSDPHFGSLNLGSAVQLLCYELRMAALADARQVKGPQPAPLGEMERMFDHLLRVLKRLRFFGTRSPLRTMARLRRMFQRGLPDAHEVAILRGILSQTEYMLDHPQAVIPPEPDEPSDSQ